MQPYPATRFQYRAAAISVGELPSEDIEVLTNLYQVLQVLETEVRPSDGRMQMMPDAICALADSLAYDNAIAALNQLAKHGQMTDLPAPVAKAYHDVRSGSLAALTMLLDLFRLGMGQEELAEQFYMLCRDHLKIMRNCIYDLDVEGFENDLMPVDHNVSLLEEKWSNKRYCIPDACAEIQFISRFDGVVSSCCMEFAALDRALYNLINNATRFTADERVKVVVTADQPSGHANLRFAISNAVNPADMARLKDTLTAKRADLTSLFAGGITLGGNGFGMRICADLVCHNYELDRVDTALEQGLLGIDISDEQFRVWFSCPGIWQQ